MLHTIVCDCNQLMNCHERFYHLLAPVPNEHEMSTTAEYFAYRIGFPIRERLGSLLGYFYNMVFEVSAPFIVLHSIFECCNQGRCQGHADLRNVCLMT